MARPRLSVVVPVYNVADYLPACLASIRSQAGPDLEIVAVDDGSTDDSASRLADLAAVDRRLKVVTQANQGLGAARNTGVDHATGEFLWFVDSDDLLTPGAINLLLSTIEATGSDLATGNVRRVASERTYPARFLAETFARTRLRTHIRRFSPLIADRVAWNKVFRRTFWDQHEFRFPVGVHYEDQYVTLPAHYLARSVDVRREPVYLWRVRETGTEASITQQRLDVASMRDRVHAVRYVSGFLAARGLDQERRRYDESAVTHDLRYFLATFDAADDDYRLEFLSSVNSYLATVDESAFARLPALRRLQWELVRRNDSAGLDETLQFERAGPHTGVARRQGRSWYAEFPWPPDPEPDRPADPLRINRDLRLLSTLDQLRVDADEVRVDGSAAIDLVGPVTRRLTMLAIPEQLGRPLRLTTTVSAEGRFAARLDVTAIAGRQRRWRLVLLSRDHHLRRIASWHESAGAVASVSRVVRARRGSATEIRVDLTGRGRLTLTSGITPSRAEQIRISPAGVLELVGSVGDVDSKPTHLVAVGTAGRETLQPLHTDPHFGTRRFVGRLPLSDLSDGIWRVRIAAGASHHGLMIDSALTSEVAGRAVRVEAGEDGYLALFVGG